LANGLQVNVATKDKPKVTARHPYPRVGITCRER
jgi:hypothetical protein